jgi:hypothetical protein
MSQKFKNQDFQAIRLDHCLVKITPTSSVEKVFNILLKLNSGDDVWDFLYFDQSQTISGYKYIVLSNFVSVQNIQQILSPYLDMLDKNAFYNTRIIFIDDQFIGLNHLPIASFEGKARVIGYENRIFRVYKDLESLKDEIDITKNDLYLLL